MQYVPGQRWISNAEPELGLGTVLRVEGRTVQLAFPATGVVRQYSMQTAPLTRSEFRPGERVSANGGSFIIEKIESRDGLLHYTGSGQSIAEGELDDVQNVSKADARLIAGRVDSAEQFQFRLETLERRAATRKSNAFGLMSSRIDLLPHQLRVAEIATSRRPPRVLLADEVGLGKTIEAGMILARLLATGRASRVMILLPEALIYQWYVELLRRFNLSFAIFDEERCESIETSADGRNPFEDEQLVICDIVFLRDSAKRREQALSATWDLAIVDEAHHLAWTPDSASADYTLVERFAAQTSGLILLTATPEQLGRSGHFARLRLLDPVRYDDLDRFTNESDRYVRLSGIVEKLQRAQALDANDRQELSERLGDDAELRNALDNYDTQNDAHREAILGALIDRHGTGRVMFRNRRESVGGFSKRVPMLTESDGSMLSDDQRQRLLAEFLSDVQTPAASLQLDYAEDPRLAWLIDVLETHATEKFFLTCRTKDKVLALEEALRTRSGVKIARFHEAMTLVQRDRNAAFFAEKDGARLLLCAEIGSEGRNFQFAHNVILWDLPLDPDLLEQRIGRLDRIGQRHDIAVRAIAFTGTAQHMLMHWYRDGLDAFRSSPADGRELFKRFGDRLVELAVDHAQGGEEPDVETDALIAETRAAHEELSTLIRNGRDRLLELAGQRDVGADRLRASLVASDGNSENDDFALKLFEQFGVHNEELGPRTFVLDPEYLSTEGFPGLKDGPQQITFDRATALVREEFPLLRLDHPMVAGAMDLLLGSEQGNAAFVIDDALPLKSALLEAVFVLEPVANPALHADRFLPPLPIRVAVDTKLVDRSAWQPGAAAVSRAQSHVIDVTKYRKILTALVPPMLKRCEELARVQSKAKVADAAERAERELAAELERLNALRQINPAVSETEIAAIEAERAALTHALPRSLLRLDAVRLVCSADFVRLR
ncbi:MAG: RNA polymerase-associated protein RapA [Rudaea sp.]